MINGKDNPVEWALLLYGLNDAKEHLDELIDQMVGEGAIDETDYAIQLGHVFAHLSRSWNTRSLRGEIPEGDFERLSRLPDDLDIVG